MNANSNYSEDLTVFILLRNRLFVFVYESLAIYTLAIIFR